MRFTFYILELLGKLPRPVAWKLRGNMRRDQLHFQWAPYEANLTDLIQGKFQGFDLNSSSPTNPHAFNITELWFGLNDSNRNGTAEPQEETEKLVHKVVNFWKKHMWTKSKPFLQNKLFILNCGWWPLRHTNIFDHFLNLHNLIQTVLGYKRTEAGQRTRILWMTTLPFMPPGSSNSAVMAMNQYAKKTMQETQDVEVFEQFPLLYPRLYDTVCGGHFLCVKKYGPAKGSAGMDMVHYFLHQKLCCCQKPARN